MLNRLLRIALPALLAALLSATAWAQDCPPPLQPPTPAELLKLAENARDRGFLWTIEKDGRTSHLYGTMHAQKLQWATPGPRVRQALRAASALALELDVSDPDATMKQVNALSAQPQAALPAALRARLRERMKAECIAPEALDALPPEMLVMVIEMAAARRAGLEAAFGSETVLAGAARALNKPVLSLETLAEQLNALKPANEAKLAALVDQNLRDLQDGTGRRVLRRTAQAWADRDTDAMQHYTDWCECVRTDAERMMLKSLLQDRNTVLAERIDALHARQGPLFVGIGALHMFGPDNLPDLLRARGFKVRQVF